MAFDTLKNFSQPDFMRTEKLLFKSFLMGGFECSTHRRRGGKRLDLIAATRHDEFAEADYERLLSIGMKTARDGLRWHLIEKTPHFYDFSSLEKQIEAVQKTGIQIIWDFFHYGFPDDLDIFSSAFIERFARFSAAAAEFLAERIEHPLIISPVNEISFFSWAAAEVGIFHPFEKNRGDELKIQMVQASFAAIDAIRAVVPNVRFLQTDPAIHVTATKKSNKKAAENYRLAQFQAFDMLCGKLKPELGGHPKYLDIIGLNYYFHNQWRYPSRRKIKLGHPEYRPFHRILEEFYERYNLPILIAETGIEDEARPEWLEYVRQEAKTAQSLNIPIEGICLYPIVNHPGWDDNRHCHNGLWDYINKQNEREIFEPLANQIAAIQAEITKQNNSFEAEANLLLQRMPI
jgi:beta-glucosidase/6-phospho-beta-glucosidase/beta-galactosidase